MAQRILEPGQIETLAERSQPRVRIPRETVFAQRAARLRRLAVRSPIEGYLSMLAALVDAQHATLREFVVELPSAEQIRAAEEHRMPPLHAATWRGGVAWPAILERLCEQLVSDLSVPAAVVGIISRLRASSREWLDAQVNALLEHPSSTNVDVASAPFIMAALQVPWTAAASRFAAAQVQALDVPGVCPLCGTLPVASVVYAQAQYQGYRFLHCALCAAEWHMVRVQCTRCGASGKSIAYHTAEVSEADSPAAAESGAAAVRAETCDQCRGYRKNLYQERDPEVEPLASVTLDLLLNEQGYERASGNPFLWHPGAT
jgi:FdhE protein